MLFQSRIPVCCAHLFCTRLFSALEEPHILRRICCQRRRKIIIIKIIANRNFLILFVCLSTYQQTKQTTNCDSFLHVKYAWRRCFFFLYRVRPEISYVRHWVCLEMRFFRRGLTDHRDYPLPSFRFHFLLLRTFAPNLW